MLHNFTKNEGGVLVPVCPPPPRSSLSVIVTTCAASAQLRLLGWRRGHFSHILVDESCQALETEVLVPLTFADCNTTVVLCGERREVGVMG